MRVDSRKADWIVALFVVIVCLIVVWISANLEKALAAGVTFGVFAAIIQTKWNSRNDWRFWLILSIFALIHLMVIFVAQFTHIQISLISLPFALVDAFVMLGLINWTERRFPRSSS